MAAKNYIGMRFGVRECVGQYVREGRSRLVLQCKCGDVSESTAQNARQAKGCRACVQVIHGHAQPGNATPTYLSWFSMMRRCFGQNVWNYSQYGGAGVTVCDKWKTFVGFLEDMGERPAGTSLDRIDNNLGYSKENCRWATAKQQARNKKNNVLITISGQTRCVTEWAEVSGIGENALRSRIRAGWANDRLLTPTEPRRKRKAQGE